MFYRPGIDPHGLPHDPFKACVTPRPIGWISTVDAQGVANLAPYSFFNAVCGRPPMVMFASNNSRDSLANCRTTGDFVVNVAPQALLAEINLTSAPAGAQEDEFDLAGLEKAPSKLVAAPRVAAVPVHMECRVYHILDLPSPTPASENAMVVGEVIGIHIDPSVLRDGRLDITAFTPLARLGYQDYAAIEAVFSVDRSRFWPTG